ITLRMRGIKTQDRNGPLAIPEADQRDHRINDPFGFSAHLRIGRRGPAGRADLPIRPKDAAVGSDFSNSRFAEPKVSDWLRPGERFAHGSGKIRDDLPLKTAFVLPGIQASFFKNSLGGKIAIGRVMLMQAVDCDTLWRSACRARKRVPEHVLSFV